MSREKTLESLSNRALDEALVALVCAERICVADMLARLAEVDARTMYLAEGFSSLYRYAIERLGMTDAAARNRIAAARLLARFPMIHGMVASGALHVAGLRLLSPHLTDANHRALLSAAAGKSKRAIEEMLAARFPKSDVLPLVVAQNAEDRVGAAAFTCAPSPGARTEVRESRPLSADSHAITFTIDRACKDKLAEARALLSHRVPTGDPGAIMSLALDALLANVRKQRFAVTDRPRAGRDRRPGTRYISAEDRRAVWARDGERCAFVSAGGHRCTETRFLELHHVKPYGRGGRPDAGNLQILCRAHNGYWAEVDYGAEHMERSKQAAAAAAETTPPSLEELIRASLRWLSGPARSGVSAANEPAAHYVARPGTRSLVQHMLPKPRLRPEPARRGPAPSRQLPLAGAEM